MKLPKEVPALTAKMIHKGWYDGPDGTHCLSGWVNEVVGDNRQGDFIKDKMRQELGSIPIPGFNDSHSKLNVARWWNSFWRSLGYVRRGAKLVRKGGAP